MAQGTIKSFDPQSRSGLVVDDDRNEYAYDAESYSETGHRLFRLGQRVSFDKSGEGDRVKISDLRILTVG